MELRAGSKGLWNQSKRVALCASHTSADSASEVLADSAQIDAKLVPEEVVYDKGRAGGSALAKGNQQVNSR